MRGIVGISHLRLIGPWPSNCLIWAIGQKLRYGGEIKREWSKHYRWLPHFKWRSSSVDPWSWYSVVNPGLAWYNLVYYGAVYMEEKKR